MSEKKLFVFVVLTFNHAKYIIEHLESIKYLINRYGSNYKFKLVVGDDGSRDKTIELIQFWVEQNAALFCDVVIRGDGINRGTCVNYTGLWQHINSDLFKVTAGDDVYSCTNLIQEAHKLEHNDFISGIPLILQDDEIIESNSAVFHILATDVIYKKRKFMDRMRQISVINTPSLMYNFKFVSDRGLFNFIRMFKVTEDFPMMVRIAETYDNVRFHQSDQVFVYYRRTSGSTYLVRGSDFENDKVKVFNHMLAIEQRWLDRVLLKNRIWCFRSDNKFKKRCLNLNYYVYVLNLLPKFFPLLSRFRRVEINISTHVAHYQYLRQQAKKTLQMYSQSAE